MFFIAILLIIAVGIRLVDRLQKAEDKGIYVMISALFLLLILFVLFIGITTHNGQTFSERHQEVIQLFLQKVTIPFSLWMKPYDHYILLGSGMLEVFANTLYWLYLKKVKKEWTMADSKFIKRFYVFGVMVLCLGILDVLNMLPNPNQG